MKENMHSFRLMLGAALIILITFNLVIINSLLSSNDNDAGSDKKLIHIKNELISDDINLSMIQIDENLIWSNESTRDPFYKLIEAHRVGNTINQAYYDAIVKYADEYRLDPEVVSALVAKECSYNNKARHDLVKVKTRDGIVTTRAVGAGVIYEIWKEELEDISIESKEDLYDIDTNIKATCHILSILKDRRQLRGSKDATQSMLLRYYGVIRRLGSLDLTYYNEVMSIKNKYIKG